MSGKKENQSDDTGKPAETGRTQEDLAGPHATPEQTNEEATPGAGTMPTEPTGDVDPGAG